MPLTHSGGTRATAIATPVIEFDNCLRVIENDPATAARNGNTEIDQVRRRAASDLRLHIADSEPPTEQRFGAYHRHYAKANGDGGESDQWSIAHGQSKGQAKDVVHQRGDDHGPNHNRRAVGNQPEGGDQRRTDQKEEKTK